ncbi:hypothetical protein MKW94_007168 [Papaver nudicaule]|uniref:Uncharacterized protein n=1 Tax=Papaver nudicaule TaxID=74823 RepID=A0AA41V5Q3_PAPNU|nr:hypothetical protein [Papaver nudicaule]
MKSLLRKYMGACLVQSRRPKRITDQSPVDSTCSENVVRVVKMDGKVVEYQSSVSVKDVLVNFNGFGVATSNSCSSQILPPNYELKAGRDYYLVPNSQMLAKTDNKFCGEVKQIKVIITKQQLQELLSKQGSIEDLISKVSKGLFKVGDRNLKLYRKDVNR